VEISATNVRHSQKKRAAVYLPLFLCDDDEPECISLTAVQLVVENDPFNQAVDDEGIFDPALEFSREHSVLADLTAS